MNHYIFRLRNGCTYQFYAEKGNTFVFRKLLKDSTWSKSTTLLTDTTESLSMVADFNHNFHIIYQNTSGSIIYSVYDTTNLKVYEMLKSRTNELYERYFQILHAGNTLHFFYLLKKDELYSIIHQSLHNLEFSMPKIIGTMPIQNPPIHYQVIGDSMGNIHLFYLSDDTIIYKKFLSETLVWQDLPNITCGGKVCNNFSACINKNLNLFLAYQRLEADKSISFIVKSLKNKDRFFSEHKIDSSAQMVQYVEILPLLDDLLVCYFDANNYYIRYLEKLKSVWEQPKKISLNNFKIGQYTSYYPQENISIGSTPYSMQNGLSIPLLDKVNLGSIHKKMIEEEISMLKVKMSNLEKALYEKNIDLEKLIIKVKFLENRR